MRLKLVKLVAWIDDHILNHRFQWVCDLVWDAQLANGDTPTLSGLEDLIDSIGEDRWQEIIDEPYG